MSAVVVGADPVASPSKSVHMSYGIPGKPLEDALLTTCGAAVPLLLPNPPEPVKEAVMVWLPTERVEVEKVA